MIKHWDLPFRYWLISVLTILFIGLLWWAREMIGPLVIGALLAFLLNPAIEFLSHHTRLSRSWVATIVLFIGLGGVIALSALLVPILIDEIQVLFVDFQDILAQMQVLLSQPVVVLNWELTFEYLIPDLTRLLSESITTIPENAFLILEATSKNLIWGLVVLATVYYLLRDWVRLRDWVFNAIPEGYRGDARQMYTEIKRIWQGYLRGNLALMVVTGVMFSLAWLAVGLPGALILGLIAGILTIIPDLGPAIAAVLATVVALFEGSSYLQMSNLWFAALVTGVYLLLINIKNIWIRPRIFARSVHMHDGIVFIAIMAAVVLQGILGALVIVPVLASAGVVGRYIYRQLLGTSSASQIRQESDAKNDQDR